MITENAGVRSISGLYLNKPKSFFREHFGAFVASIAAIAASVAALIFDESANQPPNARIWMHAHVPGQVPFRLETDETLVTVPINTPLTLSAERSIDVSADPSNLSYKWRVGQLPCSTAGNGSESDNCEVFETKNLRSWVWTPNKIGAYALTLSVKNTMSCNIFQSWLNRFCVKSHSKTFLIHATERIFPTFDVFPQDFIQVDSEQLFIAQDVRTFDGRSPTFEWRLNGAVVSRSSEYLLKRDYMITGSESNGAVNSILSLIVRDSWGQPSEIIAREVRPTPRAVQR